MTDIAPATNLTSRAVKSSAWLFGAKTGARMLALGQVFVLAKLLTPEQFGVLAMAFIALEFLRTFTEMGLEQALIQRTDDISAHMNTAWTVQVIRGALLGTLLLLFGPMYAEFFSEPEAGNFIRAFGASVFVMSLRNIGLIEFKKNVQYERLVSFEVIPQVVAVVTTLAVAFAMKSVWALFWGNLVKSTLSTIISYRIHPYRPRFRFGRKEFSDLFGFSKWIYLTTLLLFALNQGDDIVVGRLEGTVVLGIYQIAFKTARLPVTEVNSTLARVLFPAYAEIQHDLARLRDAYLKTVRFVLMATAPVSFGIFVIAPYAIPGLLGAKWEPAVPVAQVFAILGLLVSVGSTTSSVFRAVGRPQITTQAQFVRALVMFALLFPLIDRWGEVGAAWAVVLSEVTIAGFLVHRVCSEVNTSIASLLRVGWVQIIASVIMAAAVWFAAELFTDPASAVVVVILAFIGLVSYAAALLALDRVFNQGIATDARQLLRRRKS